MFFLWAKVVKMVGSWKFGFFFTKVGCDVFFFRTGGGVFFWGGPGVQKCVLMCAVFGIFLCRQGGRRDSRCFF